MRLLLEAGWRRLRHQLGLRGRSGKDHPSVEMLAAYHDDQLSRKTDEEIQEHLVDCPECPDLVLDLDRFTSPQAVEAAKDSLSDTWVDAAWRKLRSRLAAEADPARPALRWLRNPLLAWCLTVLLTPCAVRLWLRVGELGEEMNGLAAPQLNPPSLRVETASALHGAQPALPELAVPAGARQFLLVLLSSDRSQHEEYRLEIRDGRGESLWEESGLHKNSDGDFVITLTRGFLPAGAYLFRVTGLAGGGDVPFPEEFPLRLIYR